MIRIRFFGLGELIQNGLGIEQYCSRENVRELVTHFVELFGPLITSLFFFFFFQRNFTRDNELRPQEIDCANRGNNNVDTVHFVNKLEWERQYLAVK